MAAHIVIVCPEWWSESTVSTLAHRLAEDELPETVGVEIHGLSFMGEVLRPVAEDDAA